MIHFNKKDYFMPSIEAEAKMKTLAVQKHYRVFGLKGENNPPLLLRFNRQTIPEDRMAMLAHVLKKSGLEVECYRDYDKGLAIGIRRDVREEVLYSAALLQTIIYYIEGRIDLPKSFRIPSDKKFKRNGVVVPPEGSEQAAPDDMERLYEYYYGHA